MSVGTRKGPFISEAKACLGVSRGIAVQGDGMDGVTSVNRNP